jgi:outer membrane lipase/esterase
MSKKENEPTGVVQSTLWARFHRHALTASLRLDDSTGTSFHRLWTRAGAYRRSSISSALSGLTVLVLLGPDTVLAQNPVQNVPGQNATQLNMDEVIFDACANRNAQLTANFKTRCDNVVGASLDGLNSQALNAIQDVSPEQLSAIQDQATNISGGTLTVVNRTIWQRVSLLRIAGAGSPGVRFAINGQPVFGNAFEQETGGAASADASDIVSPWGGFINMLYNWGDVDGTFKSQLGFDFDNWGVIGGADYRFTDNFILGGAVSYFNTDDDFDHNAGKTESDSYNGSIFGTYYWGQRFFIDGVASIGKSDFDTKRRIQYTLPSNSVGSGDIVNTTANGHPDATQFSFTTNAGYNANWEALTATPYVRASYSRVDLDSYNESNGDGWAMAVDSQDFASRTTTLGTQVAYAVSTRWGVVVPQVRGEWTHEFNDGGRGVRIAYLGDPARQKYTTEPDNGDKDYFNVGVEVAGTFAHGVSGFLGYEKLLGYSDISSNTLEGGIRVEF